MNRKLNAAPTAQTPSHSAPERRSSFGSLRAAGAVFSAGAAGAGAADSFGAGCPAAGTRGKAGGSASASATGGRGASIADTSAGAAVFAVGTRPGRGRAKRSSTSSHA